MVIYGFSIRLSVRVVFDRMQVEAYVQEIYCRQVGSKLYGKAEYFEHFYHVLPKSVHGVTLHMA